MSSIPDSASSRTIPSYIPNVSFLTLSFQHHSLPQCLDLKTKSLSTTLSSPPCPHATLLLPPHPHTTLYPTFHLLIITQTVRAKREFKNHLPNPHISQMREWRFREIKKLICWNHICPGRAQDPDSRVVLVFQIPPKYGGGSYHSPYWLLLSV